MELFDLSITRLIEAIGQAIVPIVYEGVKESTPAFIIRRQAYVNAEIMGRIAAVLHSGNQISPDIVDRIDFFTSHMRNAYNESMKDFLGPEGGLADFFSTIKESN